MSRWPPPSTSTGSTPGGCTAPSGTSRRPSTKPLTTLRPSPTRWLEPTTEASTKPGAIQTPGSWPPDRPTAPHATTTSPCKRAAASLRPQPAAAGRHRQQPAGQPAARQRQSHATRSHQNQPNSAASYTRVSDDQVVREYRAALGIGASRG